MAGNIRQQFFEDVNSRNCGWNPSTAKWKLTKPKKASYQFWQILSQCVQNFCKLGSAQYLSLLVFLLDYSINSINYAQSPLLSVRLPKLPCWRYKENLLLFFLKAFLSLSVIHLGSVYVKALQNTTIHWYNMSFLSCFVFIAKYMMFCNGSVWLTGHTFILFTIFFAEPSLPLIMDMFPNQSQTGTLSLFHYWQTQIILGFPQNMYKSRSSEGAKQSSDK